MVWTAEDNQ